MKGWNVAYSAEITNQERNELVARIGECKNQWTSRLSGNERNVKGIGSA